MKKNIEKFKSLDELIRVKQFSEKETIEFLADKQNYDIEPGGGYIVYS